MPNPNSPNTTRIAREWKARQADSGKALFRNANSFNCLAAACPSCLLGRTSGVPKDRTLFGRRLLPGSNRRAPMYQQLTLSLAIWLVSLTAIRAGESPEQAAPPAIKVATFDVAATPPLGSAMAYDPVRRLDELTLRWRDVVTRMGS